MARSLNKWKLTQQVALIDLDAETSTRLEIDLSSPSGGANLKYSDSQSHQLFGIVGLETGSDEALDPYARGRDLIVRYPFSDSRKIGAELYWRVGEHLSSQEEGVDGDERENPEGLQTLELIYSLETGELDAKPNPKVISKLAGSLVKTFHLSHDGEQLENEAKYGCLLKCDECQVFLMSLPSDLDNMKISQGETCEVQFELKSNFLEKGVIRRARLLMVVGKLELPEDLFLSVSKNFLRSKIPLTT